MKTHYLIFVAIAFLFTGCAYDVFTRERAEKLKPEVADAGFFSTLDTQYVGEQAASIGDPLFRVNRYAYGKGDNVQFDAPTGQPFPNDGEWIATHIYDDGSSGELNVFTNPNYYEGAIGVILDDEGRAATNEPLVQVDGAKAGRRWALSGAGKFFDLEPVLVDWWTLRYGGTSDGDYIFEIIKEAESSSSEVLQSVRITEESFRSGFTIRGVFVQGVQEDDRGVIKYVLKDTLTSE